MRLPCREAAETFSGGRSGLTANERAWLEFLRLVSAGRDPAPDLREVQLLQRLLRRCSAP